MSVTWRAYTVIGIQLHRSDLYKKIPLTACSNCTHEFSSKRGNYCSNCGKYIEDTTEVAIDSLMFDGRSAPILLDCYEIITTDDVDYFVGSATGVDDPGNAIMGHQSIDIEAFRRTMKNDLEPLGLWRDGAFGIWTILIGQF